MDTTSGRDATHPLGAQVDDFSLCTIKLGVSDDEAIDAAVPEVQAMTEERVQGFHISSDSCCDTVSFGPQLTVWSS